MRSKLPVFARLPSRYAIPSKVNRIQIDTLAFKQRLLYRGTPNRIFHTLLTMSRRPVNSQTIGAKGWNFQAKVPYPIGSVLPGLFADMGIATVIYRDLHLIYGAMLNAEGLKVLDLIALRDDTHRAYVEAYYPKDGLAGFNRWLALSNLNRSRLNPENDQYFEELPF